MIILDNSVLSAFTRLELFSQLEEWVSSAIISKEVLKEYTKQWHKKVPDWIKIKKPSKNIDLPSAPISLSTADLSILKLSIEFNIPIASDDKPIRQFAKRAGIKITGSLGLLKALYLNNKIKSLNTYLKSLNLLQKDLYLSKELIKWALEGIVEDTKIEELMERYEREWKELVED
jgi:predicted nucleic acid-binding protein